MIQIPESYISGLERLVSCGGSISTSRVEDKNLRDIWGGIEAGMGVYRKLEKLGYVIIKDEEPDETGFTWTPIIEITESGRKALIGTKVPP